MVMDMSVIHWYKIFKDLRVDRPFSDIEYYTQEIISLSKTLNNPEYDEYTDTMSNVGMAQCADMAQQLLSYSNAIRSSEMRASIVIDPQSNTIIIDEGIQVEFRKK